MFLFQILLLLIDIFLPYKHTKNLLFPLWHRSKHNLFLSFVILVEYLASAVIVLSSDPCVCPSLKIEI